MKKPPTSPRKPPASSKPTAAAKAAKPKMPTKAQLAAYEKTPRDRAEDRKSGAREGSALDRKQDIAGARALFQSAGKGTPINVSPPATLGNGKKAPALKKGGAGAY